MTRTGSTALGFILGLAAAPLALVVAAPLGWLPVASVASPWPWEERIGQAALEASLAKASSDLRSPVAETDDTLLAGMKLYRDNCAGCHGDSAHPSHWGASNFYPRVPQFAAHAPDLTAPQMFVAVKYGIRYSGMGAWEGMMSDDDIWRTVAFLSRLRALPPPVRGAWEGAR